MRIGLDLRMLGGGSGLDRYISELSHAMLSGNHGDHFVLFFKDVEKSEVYKKYNQEVVITNISHYSFKEQIFLPRILKKQNLDLMHFPHFNVPLLYRGKFIVTIHDLTHTLVPGKKKSHFFHRLAYNWVFRNAVLSSAKIIAVSYATKKAIVDYFGIDQKKIVVVYEGINHKYKQIDKAESLSQVSNRFGISKPYILYVGEWRRYKNLPMLARAFERLVEDGQDLELVLVGKEDEFYPEIRGQVYSISEKDRIKALGRVSDEDLNIVYNAATLFVLPSTIEGFGLTVLEAAACGVPIACSDIPSLREVAGIAANYFDPNNLESMVEVMKKILNQKELQTLLTHAGLLRIKEFSWEKAAAETMEAYS